jgi:signal transduction histidine kinase
MMKRALLLIAICLALPATAFGQTSPWQENSVESNHLANVDDVTFLGVGWNYHKGDNPEWAFPDYDDSGWDAAYPLFTPDKQPPGGFDGNGWWRLRLDVDPAVAGKPMSLMLWHWGASEVYLDGDLVTAVGKPGTSADTEVVRLHHDFPAVRPIRFEAGGQHVIAVRHSFHGEPVFRHGASELTWGGFAIILAEPETAHSRVRERVRYEATFRGVLGAMALTFALIHFLFFLFYPKFRPNLHYAIMTLAAAFLALLPLKFKFAETPEEIARFVRGFQIALVVTSVAGLRFLYGVFRERLPRYFWIWPVAGWACLIVFWQGPLDYFFLFSLVSFIEIMRVLVIAVIRRKPAAWLIAIGTSAFVLTSAYQLLAAIGVFREDTEVAYLYGLMTMLICMSIALANGFARINKTLHAQVVQIKDLSDRTLEHERLAKEQEMARLQLEEENKRKAVELEEAYKRQKVLDELEKTNHELRQTQSQLVQSEKMAALGNLVAGVAHEINTPVGAMCSMHDTLIRAVGKLKRAVKEMSPEEFESNRQLQRSFKIIEDANGVIASGSERVTDIVKRLRSFARLDEAELKKANIHEGIEDTLTIVHHELKHGVTVTKNFGDIPPIYCYPGQLNQVFLNLLVNARQAIDGNGELAITTWNENGYVYIEFKDTGCGIPPDKLPKVFDPGFTTKGVGVGTGLGLSICYNIIQAHKGEIKVSSEVGKGATFTIKLPTNLEDPAS